MQGFVIGSDEFFEYWPKRESLTPVLSISEQGFATVSKPLRDELGRKVILLATNDEQKIAIKPTENKQAFTIPKSGSIKAASFMRGLIAAGVTFPARYEFIRAGEYWIGTRVPVQSSAPLPDKAANKPRKRGLKDMLP